MAKNMKIKAEKIAATEDKRPYATAKYVRISPYKVRTVLALIRGKSGNLSAAKSVHVGLVEFSQLHKQLAVISGVGSECINHCGNSYHDCAFILILGIAKHEAGIQIDVSCVVTAGGCCIGSIF